MFPFEYFLKGFLVIKRKNLLIFKSLGLSSEGKFPSSTFKGISSIKRKNLLLFKSLGLFSEGKKCLGLFILKMFRLSEGKNFPSGLSN